MYKFVYIVIVYFILIHQSNAQTNSTAIAGNCYAVNGLYVWGLAAGGNSSERILGNTVKENALLTYAKNNGFNYLLCYELQVVTTDDVEVKKLAAFIKKAKTQYGIQQIGAAIASTAQADLMVAYNKAHATIERIDVLNVEDEFWNVPTNQRASEFNYVIQTLTYFKSLAVANALETEIYIGQITADEGLQLGNVVDRVLVHFYRQNDIDIINYNTVRLQYLAAANKKVRVAPIFSNEGPTNTQDIPFMGTWLESHPQDQAFKSWMSGYNALTASWKNNLEIMGAQWFIYDNFMDSNATSHITLQPSNEKACLGDTKIFTTASSATAKVYYWMKDGNCLSDGGSISGARTAALKVTNISAKDAGNYYCRVVSSDANNPTSFASLTAVLSIGATCNQAPTVSISSPVNNNSFTAPASITINANAADADGTVSKVDFYNGSTFLGSDATIPYSCSWTGVAAGTYTLTAKATDNANAVTTSSSISIVVNPASIVQSPYGGVAWAIPGKIQAENYDLGGQGVAFNDMTTANEGGAYRTTEAVDIEACTDTDAGYNVGYTVAGEWLEYTVQVAANGSYNLAVRIAATAAGKTFHVEMDGVNISGTITVPNTTDWQIWQTVSIYNITLTAGQKIMKVAFDSGDFNLNYVTFSPAIIVTNQAPTVSLTSPVNNSFSNAPASISIAATASDADGTVSKVDFYSGATLLFSDNTSPYSYTWTGVVAGFYAITAKATDNSGASTTSSAISVTVNTVNVNSCSAIAQYIENGNYTSGSKVKNTNNQYQCKPYPYSGWCNGAAWAYAPGTGAYWSDAWILVGSCGTARSADDAFAVSTTITNSPNPFVATTDVQVIVTEAGEFSVVVYNKAGQAVATIVEGYLTAGTHTFTFDASVLKSDLYLVKYHSANGVATQKMIKLQ